ncbi:MAG: hypothetical protein IJB11_05360 [Oscillospiraceae bacterium]|nr:hypothetical protein [Oscillospiraceae bacterium]
MKRWIVLALALPMIAFLGGKDEAGRDVARLQPMEVLAVTMEDDGVRIETDTGDAGRGANLEAAIDNLKSTTSGEIFLDTAEYLLIAGCEPLLPELAAHLRPSCQVCLVEGEVELESVAQFLKIHQPELTLAEYRGGIRTLKTLKEEKGRFRFVS